MNIIVDTCVINCVFDRKSSRFKNFEPIFKCICNRTSKGKMIFGGSKFKKELSPILKGDLREFFFELRNIGKLIELDQSTVDEKEKTLKIIEPKKDFDDEHIIACVILAKCSLVCSDDKRNDKYIKDPRFYQHSKDRPKIYKTLSKHKNLLLC